MERPNLQEIEKSFAVAGVEEGDEEKSCSDDDEGDVAIGGGGVPYIDEKDLGYGEQKKEEAG